MSSLTLFAIILVVLAFTEARVTFPYSEVLQFPDLQNNRAAFNCPDGCRLYGEPYTDQLSIAQKGTIIANFTALFYWNDDGATVSGYFDLPAGDDYSIVHTSTNNFEFTFYAVSIKAPNFGTQVVAANFMSLDGQGRFITVVSRYNAMTFYNFSGTFPSGYPKIYATGFDAIGDKYGVSQCTPVYQARSQRNAEQSSPLIYTSMFTVDFGYEGKHSVLVNGTFVKLVLKPAKTAASSTVYMSPGYVGCPSVGDQSYHNEVSQSISDDFTMISDSLDISAAYNALTASETVKLTVNQDHLDFNNDYSSSFSKHYDDGAFRVSLSWARKTQTSSWAIQLDFGTVPSSTTIVAAESTTSTESGSISLFLASIIVFAFVSN